MTDKNDPDQKNIPVDFDDDDDIIELTNEIFQIPKKEDEYIDLQDTGKDAPETRVEKSIETDGQEPDSVDDGDIFGLDRAPDTESEAEGTVLDPDEVFAGHDPSPGEDEIIASAIAESLGDDDDEPTLDSIMTGHAPDTASETEDEEVFDTEEEIDLKYESSEDEYDFFAMDDRDTLEELETIAMADDEPDDSAEKDMPFDPLVNLNLDLAGDDEMVAMEADSAAEPDLMAFDDEETLEFDGEDDLPDMTDEIDFEFDNDDDLNEGDASEDQIAENIDDIMARSIEQSLAADEVTSQGDLAMGSEFDFAEDSNMTAEEGDLATEDELTAKTKEELRALAEADDLTDFDEDDLEFEDEENGEPKFDDDTEETGIEDGSDPDSEIEILAFEDLEDASAEEDDDIIEITEFDEHIPEEDEKKLERAGVFDAVRPDEDDFLELIEVEDDDLVGDEGEIEFGKAEDTIDEDKIDTFFSVSREDEPAFENEEAESAEDTPALSTDMAMATTSTDDEEDEFDFSFDSSDISKEVDRLDAFLSDDSIPEPEVASLPSKGFDGDETMENDQPEVEAAGEPSPMSPDQIDAILERVIKDKFGGKIENVIYEAIEKAVSKEIDRLKDALLDSGGVDSRGGENE